MGQDGVRNPQVANAGVLLFYLLRVHNSRKPNSKQRT